MHDRIGGPDIFCSGVGFWARSLPTWCNAVDYVKTGAVDLAAPERPTATLLAPNERRRAPSTAALAICVAAQACEMAKVNVANLPVVFASCYGEMKLTDEVCKLLASRPLDLSPIRFHNSVLNAAAGYWTISAGCMRVASVVTAGPYTFCMGLMEAIGLLCSDAQQVLLVGYDGPESGPLGNVARSEGYLAGAVVLTRSPAKIRLDFSSSHESNDCATGPLTHAFSDNAAAGMLPFFDVLAQGQGQCTLAVNAWRRLTVTAHASDPGQLV